MQSIFFIDSIYFLCSVLLLVLFVIYLIFSAVPSLELYGHEMYIKKKEFFCASFYYYCGTIDKETHEFCVDISVVMESHYLCCKMNERALNKIYKREKKKNYMCNKRVARRKSCQRITNRRKKNEVKKYKRRSRTIKISFCLISFSCFLLLQRLF